MLSYMFSDPVSLYRLCSLVLYFLAAIFSDHFSKQTGLKPGCRVTQHGIVDRSARTDWCVKLSATDLSSWQHQASRGF